MENVIQLDDIVYLVQGMKFKLNPRSINARKAAGDRMSYVNDLIDKQIKMLKDNIRIQNMIDEKIIKGDEWDGGEIPEFHDVSDMEPYDPLFELFCAITTGPHEDLDRGNFDTRYAERAKEDFLPDAYKTRIGLTDVLGL